jgi:hypothetical protein
MPAPLVGAAAAAAARLIAKKLATKTVKKAVTPAARVRKNTNAVAKVVKNTPVTRAAAQTNVIQKRSVREIPKGVSFANKKLELKKPKYK